MPRRREDRRGPVRKLVRSIPPLHRTAVATVQRGKHLATITHIREGWVSARAILRPRGHPPGKFVVFGQGRSGSSLLLDLVGSHPEVYCEAEIFHGGAHSKLISPWRYLNSRAALSPRSTYGCQLKIYQMTDDQGIEDVRGFLIDMLDAGWKIVFLTRKDLFRKALSLVVAEARGQFLDLKSGKPSLGSMRIDPNRLLEVMRERGAADEEERRVLSGLPHLTVVYEEDLLDGTHHQTTCDRVLAFLGLDPVSVETEFRRTSRDRFRDYVENFDEIRDAIAATEMASALPEAETA